MQVLNYNFLVLRKHLIKINLNMKPTLSFECNENWDRMKIGVLSRFCESCQRDVMDFTKMNREETLHYLWMNRNEKVCGRFYKSQLDFHHEEILITVEAFLKKNKNSNLAFYLLAASALMLLGCREERGNKSILDRIDLPLVENYLQMISVDTVEVKAPDPPVNDDKLKFVYHPSLVFESFPRSNISFGDSTTTYGFVFMTEPSGLGALYPDADISRLTPVMPEFVGGYDSLLTFMKENLQYPEWEKKNRVEGVVVVAFVIDSVGNVTQPKIVRTLPNSKNVDAEVLRVVNLMPRWIPGREFDKNVPVEFTLPVRFKI
jgi:TonB family protein